LSTANPDTSHARRCCSGLFEYCRTTAIECRLLVLCLAFPLSGVAWEDKGAWNVTGNIVDIRSTLQGLHFTNTLTVTGYYDDGRFSLEIIPIKTDDEIAESAAWDGERLRLIQRYPETPKKGLPRDQSLAYVERSIFSRYATHPTLAVMLALADTNSLNYLVTGQEPIILAGSRAYPEEQNTYKLLFPGNGGMSIEALCPGREISEAGESPIPGFKDGFLRWKFALETPQRSDDGMSELVLWFDYSRFIPSGSKLFEYRRVQGALTLHKASQAVAQFKPLITESRLRVLDYSRRKEFYPFTKGLTDSAYGYELASQTWDFDEGIIDAWASEVKSGWELKGVPNNVEETSYVAPNYAEKRRIAFWALLIIFLSLPLIIWQIKRKHKPEQEGTKCKRNLPCWSLL